MISQKKYVITDTILAVALFSYLLIEDRYADWFFTAVILIHIGLVTFDITVHKYRRRTIKVGGLIIDALYLLCILLSFVGYIELNWTLLLLFTMSFVFRMFFDLGVSASK